MGGFLRDNKAWAKTIPMPEDKESFRRNAYLVVDQVNPGLVDLFTRQARKDRSGERKRLWSAKAQTGAAAHKPAAHQKDAAIRDREFERLSAKNGAGWLCGQAGTAGAEGVGFPDAPKQQQLESADPQSA